MNKQPVSVMQLTMYIKDIIENDSMLSRINVRGEISNFKYHSSGHMYFTLKDENAKIKCVMFRGYNAFLKFRPEDGMSVVIEGNISIYEKDGQYQLYCSKMEPDGVGGLYLAYEQLKVKLQGEGLFNKDIKKPIPLFPRRIGVATSPTGAVIRDIINVAKIRFYKSNILLYPVKVQGAGAAETIVEAIKYFNNMDDIDVIIIGRGGGSIEELWAFNEEILARAINQSKIPIISAVGHETDFTIADFTADMRASTPTHAAEIAVPSYEELVYKLGSIKGSITSKFKNNISQKKLDIKGMVEDINRNSPKNRIIQYIQYIDNTQSKMNLLTKNRISNFKNSFSVLAQKLDTLSPVKTLCRGYSVMVKDKKVISNVKLLEKEDNIKVYMQDGCIDCKVVEVSEGSLWKIEKKM